MSCSSTLSGAGGLKGNQVRILNRPAAVSSQKGMSNYRKCHCLKGGKADKPE